MRFTIATMGVANLSPLNEGSTGSRCASFQGSVLLLDTLNGQISIAGLKTGTSVWLITKLRLYPMLCRGTKF